MVNLTLDSVVFNVEGAALDGAIRSALALAADTSLQVHDLADLNLASVTTKSYLRGTFAKFVRRRVLAATRYLLGKEYVEQAFLAYRQKTGQLNEAQFSAVMLPEATGGLSFKRSYAVSIRPGLGLFLVALHSSGAITLPMSFPWPSVREDQQKTGGGKRREIGKLVASELLAFVRSLDTQSDGLPHPAFEAVGSDRKRREWFLTYGTKLLLATGWHRPEDVNVTDLLAIKSIERSLNPGEPIPLAYKAMLDVLALAFEERVSVSAEDWASALRTELGRGMRLAGQPAAGPASRVNFFKDGPRYDHDLLEEILMLEPSWGRAEHLRSLTRLPGLDKNPQELCGAWLELQKLYQQKTARENYGPINQAFSWWNIYLFYYLPYWFARNPESRLTFPTVPGLLVKSAFVSRLLPTTEERPITFVEYMDAQWQRRGWSNNGYYGLLLRLQGFFGFIERFSDDIPGCAGFVQPISQHDYPRTTRPKASRKQPVPRRFFGVYIDIHEALLAHLQVVSGLIVSGALSTETLRVVVRNGRVIDTFETADSVGFIPVLFTPTRAIPLRHIPNLLDLGWRTLKDGRKLMLPHPHALHQNLVALHTGLRHNHLQWLDAELFDSRVDEADVDFSLLFVNTDKQKREPWTPHVSMRVIELLRAQRAWAELIGEPGFKSLHFYNNNPRTKWPRMYPLFAYTADGSPHADDVYTDAWQSTLCALQGLAPELSEFGRIQPFVRLLPPGCKADDPDLSQRLAEYGASLGTRDSCTLNVKTTTTPHSARVAVVSQYITFLPTDLIGKYITGHAPGAVPYYVHLDRETLEAEQVHQASRMRAAVTRGTLEPVLSGERASSTFIHADAVNSNLARSIRINLDETIVSHGGMSISFTDRSERGLDVLRTTKCADAAFNKTEVCPYGNACPADVLKELGGMRRCGLCGYAVRTIDHLPAVVAKKRQVAEMVDEIEAVLATDAKTLNGKFTPAELDTLEAERAALCEELSGWVLNEEILEVTRQRLAAGQDTREWVVQRPEILERDLRRVLVATSTSEYVLARLGECISFPTLESPQIRARFDLLRRELLARAGRLKEAFSAERPVDPAAECAGMLKVIAATSGLSLSELAEMLDSGAHLAELPKASLRLLAADEAA